MKTLALVVLFLLLPVLASAQSTGNQCSSNATACTYASQGYASGGAGICINGTCILCVGTACSSACTGLGLQEQGVCARAVGHAQGMNMGLRQAAATEKAEMVDILQRQLRELKDRTFIQGLSDTDLAGYPAKIKIEETRVDFIASDLGTALPGRDAASTADFIAQVTAAVAQEQACRADKKCMVARAVKKAEEQFFANVVQPMCQADMAKEAATQDMATERANPSGYVDKVRLHDDGETIQASQAQLAAGAPTYAKVRHHAWPGWRKECKPAAAPTPFNPYAPPTP